MSRTRIAEGLIEAQLVDQRVVIVGLDELVGLVAEALHVVPGVEAGLYPWTKTQCCE
jgi:hypothetical protein